MFIVKDWAGNHLFQDKEFKTFEGGWDFLYEWFDENEMDPEEWAQEYEIEERK